MSQEAPPYISFYMDLSTFTSKGPKKWLQNLVSQNIHHLYLCFQDTPEEDPKISFNKRGLLGMKDSLFCISLEPKPDSKV